MATYSGGQTAALGDIVQHTVSKRVGFVNQLDSFPGAVAVNYFSIVGTPDVPHSMSGTALFAGPVAVTAEPFTDVAVNFALLYPTR